MKIIQSSGTGVAGNVTTSIVVPENEIRTPMYGQVILTTDATVASRRAIIRVINESSVNIFDSHSGAVVTASTADQHHEFMQGIFRETTFIGNAIQVPIPNNFVIPPGFSLQFLIENGVAGDSYSYYMTTKVEDVVKGSVLVE